MARVSVEQKALIDPRFAQLGCLLGTTRHDALGRMILVWNECQEKASYFLPIDLVSAIMENKDGAKFVLAADLCVKTDRKTVRIKGTEGRVEWLAVKRENAKANGKKGGRPTNQSKTDVGSPTVTAGPLLETPPAPAPAPAPAQQSPSEIGRSEDTTTEPARKRFTPPTVDEVAAYVATRSTKIDPQRFIDHYTANGWRVGKNPMRDWKASVRTWELNEYANNGTHKPAAKPTAFARQVDNLNEWLGKDKPQ